MVKAHIPPSALVVAALLAPPATGQALQLWTGDLSGDRLGWSVDVVADVDLDGIDDVLVGVPFAPVASLQVGLVRVYSSVSGALLLEVPGDAALDHAGWSVAGLGDVNADGRGDFVVGLPDSDLGVKDAGLARLISGGNGATLEEWAGSATAESFGYSVARAGDINLDGRDDVLIGAWRAGAMAGRVEVRSGASGTLLRQHVGLAPGDRLGWSLACLGDVNGDAREDYALGATQEGLGSGYLLVVSGLSGAVLRVHAGATAGESFASACSRLGDVNGDGRGDYAVGAPLASGLRGRVDAFSGLNGSPLWSRAGQTAGEQFGAALDGGLDIDANTVPDLLAGAPLGAAGKGRVAGLAGASGATLREWTGSLGGDRFGAAVAQIENVDADAGAEAVVGAPREDLAGIDAGAARLLSSSSGGCVLTPYCTAKTNSLGCLPLIGWSGTPSLSGPGDFAVSGSELLSKSVGIVIWAHAPDAKPFLGGFLCLAPPVIRGPPIQTGGNPPPIDCSGALSMALTPAFMSQQGWVAGTPVHVQIWSRDPLHPDGTTSSLSAALAFLVCP